MGKKQWVIVSVGLIIGLAAIDIVLLVRLSQYRTANTQWLSDIRKLGSQAHVYETYIVKNFRYTGIPAKTLYNTLSTQDKTIAFKDSVFVVLLPSGACEACANALFERLEAEKCSPNDLYLISEIPHPVLEREWKAHGFGPVETKAQNIFKLIGLRSEILLLRINKHNMTVEPMICEPAYMKFLPIFLRS